MPKSRVSQPKRWLALRFPYLCLEALGQPFCASQAAFVEENKHVYCANQLALDAGVSLGMPSHVAQQFCPSQIQVRNSELEDQCRQQLCDQLYHLDRKSVV